jgi:hypothetical protein
MGLPATGQAFFYLIIVYAKEPHHSILNDGALFD